MRGGKLQGGKAKLKAIENKQSESEIRGLESGPEGAADNDMAFHYR
jgi:hypothetical protein